MALNTFKCNYLTPLHFKGLNFKSFQRPISPVSIACWDTYQGAT